MVKVKQSHYRPRGFQEVKEGFYVNEKSTDTGWDRTSDLSICSTAP